MLAVEERAISVVVPTLDKLDLLDKCLTGLANQSYRNYEIIVLNDGGIEFDTDRIGFKDVFDVLPKDLVRVVNFAQRRGSAKVRNLGFRMAEGELIAFTDDDAVPSDNWLVSINAYFNNNPTVTAVNGKIEAVSLQTRSERIRQAYYDGRHLLYTSGILDRQMREAYGLESPETNLADWLGLGNCTLLKRHFDPKQELFDDSMRLNYGRKLGKKLMSKGLIVTYSQEPIVAHHHDRSLKDVLERRVANGRNFCLIDDEANLTFIQRFEEMKRYFVTVFASPNLSLVDKAFESFYSAAFIASYICQKGISMVKVD